jgi:hypothetical protein
MITKGNRKAEAHRIAEVSHLTGVKAYQLRIRERRHMQRPRYLPIALSEVIKLDGIRLQADVFAEGVL